MIPFQVVCVDTSAKPNEIPISVWSLLKKDELYTVIDVIKCNVQGGINGYKLAEIDLSAYLPYIYFDARRFRILADVAEEIEKELIEHLY